MNFLKWRIRKPELACRYLTRAMMELPQASREGRKEILRSMLLMLTGSIWLCRLASCDLFRLSRRKMATEVIMAVTMMDMIATRRKQEQDKDRKDYLFHKTDFAYYFMIRPLLLSR